MELDDYTVFKICVNCEGDRLTSRHLDRAIQPPRLSNIISYIVDRS